MRRGARNNFLRAPGRAGGRKAKKLLGWIASSKPTHNTSPKDFPRRAFRLSGATRNCCTCGVPQPSEHFQFTRRVCGRRQKLQRAVWGCPCFPRAPGRAGESKRRSCWAGSHPPSRPITPRQKIPREGHFDCPGPHGTAALVASRSLRNTSSSHVETAAAGRSCKGRCGGAHVFPEPRAERGKASEGAAGLARILQAELHHLANTIPAKCISANQCNTEILHWWCPATFGTLWILMRKWAGAAK